MHVSRNLFKKKLLLVSAFYCTLAVVLFIHASYINKICLNYTGQKYAAKIPLDLLEEVFQLQGTLLYKRLSPCQLQSLLCVAHDLSVFPEYHRQPYMHHRLFLPI